MSMRPFITPTVYSAPFDVSRDVDQPLKYVQSMLCGEP